ncbi:MAG: RNA 2',3'-cyclic phosphodiesterase [Alphaproteobacteria bacterium]
MIRLFTAIEIPEGVRDLLLDLQSGLPGATWSPFDNMHLTLRFIGEVPEPMVEEIEEALWSIHAPGFSLQLKGVGKFGGEGARAPARLVYANVEHDEGLTRLQSKIEQALQDLGLDPERRKYHPHVTLARLKDTPIGRLGNYLAAHAMFSSPAFDVTEFTLFSSSLGREHSVYDPLSSFALTPPA